MPYRRNIFEHNYASLIQQKSQPYEKIYEIILRAWYFERINDY